MKPSLRKPVSKRDLIYALAGGVLFSASQPPQQTAFLAYFCLVPLMLALEGKNYRGAFMFGYIWGFVSNLISLYWIALPTLAGMIAAVLFASLYSALFAVVFSFVERRSLRAALVLAPIFWVAMEYLRGFGQLGFPWMDLGYTQGPYTVIIQMADIVGHRGISFWLVIVNVLIVAITIARKKKWVYALLLLIVFAVPIGYGLWRIGQPPPPEKVRIALLQGNITAKQKWERNFRRKNVEYYGVMADSLGEKVDLIVLPETASAYYHRDHPNVVKELAAIAGRTGTPILTGTLDYDPADRKRLYYNSSALITEQGVQNVYHKTNLVPGSEHIPFQNRFDFLRKLDFGGSHFAMGDSIVVFEAGRMKFSSPICFEILFESTVRKYALSGAEFITNITNDGWFGETPGPYQHANFCRFRAVENRFGVGRAAQTGISLIVDEKGRIVKSLPLNVKGTLIGDLPVRKRITFFTRLGDWIGAGSLFASPILLVLTGLFIKI